jgi:hypothetical protein
MLRSHTPLRLVLILIVVLALAALLAGFSWDGPEAAFLTG